MSDSSEAMLSGRKPPFRLLVRAVATDGRTVNIRHAVSEGFVARAPDPVPGPEPRRTHAAVSNVAAQRPAVLPPAAAGCAPPCCRRLRPAAPAASRYNNLIDPALSPHAVQL